MINVRHNKAFALIFSLIFLFFIISFITVFIAATSAGLVNSNRTANEIKAYYVAEAGLADAYERVVRFSPPAEDVFIPASNTDNGIYAMGDGTNGSYTVSLGASTVNGAISYIITSTGTYNKVRKILQLQINGSSITKYAYWAQVEGNASWWITGQTLTGPVQSNGSLEIWGNPLFTGEVQQVGTSINAWAGTGYDQNTTFQGSLSLGAPAVNLPQVETLTALKNAAANSGLILTGPHIIQFNKDSTITYFKEDVINGPPSAGDTGTTISAVTNSANCSYTSAPCSIIYVQNSTVNGVSQNDGTPTVHGTVSGQVTVAADQDIYIDNNIKYNDPPVRPGISGGNPNSTDLAGLVASNNIIVDITAPYNLELDGAMVAIQGSVTSQDSNYDPSFVQGNLCEFGSLVNNVLGILGWFDPGSGKVLSGWNQLLYYDSRLLSAKPPGFPPALNKWGQLYTKTSFQEL